MSVFEMILVYAICFLPLMIIFAIMPYIGRRNLTFGISIPPDSYNDNNLTNERKSFSKKVIVIGLIFCAASLASQFFLETALATGILTAIVFIYIFAISIVYLKAYKNVKSLKEKKGWTKNAHETAVADTNFTSSKRSVSSLWFLVYALIILATLVIGFSLYDNMPDKIVMQTDMQGNVTRMADKSYSVLLFGPAMQAIMAVLFGFVYWMMQRTPPVLDPDNPKDTSKQNTIFRYRWSAFTVFGGMGLLVIFLFMQLGFANILSQQATIWIPLGTTAVFVISAIILAVNTGQSGSRISVGKSTDGKVIKRDDDRYWKYGAFYVNKDDPAMFVEKRFGIGFTINFGKPAAVLLFFGFLAVIIGAVILITALSV